MEVHMLTYGSKIWTITRNRKQKLQKLQKCKFWVKQGMLKIAKNLIFIRNNKILKFRSQWKYHVLQKANKRIPKKMLIYNETQGAHS
jgi:hypothetical protein